MEELSRRCAERPRAVRAARSSSDGAVHVRLENSDTTWAEDFVRRLHDLNPESSGSCWVKEHALDTHIVIEIRGDPDVIAVPAVLADMRRDLQALRVDDGTFVRLRGTCASFAVLVRRALMTRVPVLAIDAVTIVENTSGVIDEIVAHRLGQLAVVGNGEACDGRVAVKSRTVLGADVVFEANGARIAADDAQVQVLHLREGEVFEALVHTRVGIALEHAKFSAVAAVPFWERHVLSRAPEAQVLQDLAAAGFVVDERSMELRRADGCHPVRKERVMEVAAAGSLQFEKTRDFALSVQPLGQWSADKCLELAVAAIVAEIDDFERAAALQHEAPQARSSGAA